MKSSREILYIYILPLRPHWISQVPVHSAVIQMQSVAGIVRQHPGKHGVLPQIIVAPASNGVEVNQIVEIRNFSSAPRVGDVLRIGSPGASHGRQTAHRERQGSSLARGRGRRPSCAQVPVWNLGNDCFRFESIKRAQERHIALSSYSQVKIRGRLLAKQVEE